MLHAHNPVDANGAAYVPTAVIHAAASASAELVSCAILTPAEVIKQNAQMVQSPSSSSSSRSAPSSSATLRTLSRFNGPAQLWSGYGALAARNLPFTAMQFPLYEWLKTALVSYRERSHTGRGHAGSSTHPLVERGLVTGVSAGLAGAVAAALTTPVDVVKTRIMLAAGASQDRAREGRGRSKGGSQRTSRGALSIARHILRTDGPRALWRGGALRAAWTALGSALYLGMYECGLIYLSERRQRDD